METKTYKICKICKICSVKKPPDEFYKHVNYTDGLRSYCRECARAIYSDYRNNHREQRNININNWRHDHREELNARQRKRYATDQNYRTAKIQIGKNHMAFKRGATGAGIITIKKWEDLKSQYSHRCLCCGKKESSLIQITQDHIIPVSKGGPNTIDNIQPLCEHCNKSKNSKSIDYR